MKGKKIISVLLTTVMMLSVAPLNVFAQSSIGSTSQNTSIGSDVTQGAKTEYAEVKESNKQTEVYLTVEDGEIIASVPTTIIVSGTPNEKGEYTGDYSVGVDGDMSGNKIVVVEPESPTVELQQTGKQNKSASITQEKTEFNATEVANNTTTTGKATATGLTAGTWNGKTNFIIEVREKLPIPTDYTVLYKYDLSATEKDDVAAYYCVPTKNTEKLPLNRNMQKLFNTNTSIDDKTIIEHDGIKYILSDKDTLVISGNGKMKDNISNDIIDYDGIRTDVAQHFDVDVIVSANAYDHYVDKTTYYYHNQYSMYPYAYISKGSSFVVHLGSNITEYDVVKSYTDTIKSNYGITIKNIEVCEGVTNISNSAFVDFNELKNITIADTVTSIGTKAFQNCNSLVSINIPSKVTSIGSYAFSNCKSLLNLAIPNSVTSIGSYAFASCWNLETIKLSEQLDKISSRLFYDCVSLKDIIIPSNVTQIGSSAFRNCYSLKTIKIPTSVTRIDSAAFIRSSDAASDGMPVDEPVDTLIIYCPNQQIANLLKSGTTYDSSNVSVIVDSSQFE